MKYARKGMKVAGRIKAGVFSAAVALVLAGPSSAGTPPALQGSGASDPLTPPAAGDQAHGPLTPSQVEAAEQAVTDSEIEPSGALGGMKGLEGLSPEEIMMGREMLEKEQKKEETEPEKTLVPPSAPSETETGAREASLFDRYRDIGAYQDIDTSLRPFGYGFFSGAAGRPMTPRKDIPVAADYVVGPGDEVRLNLWGRVNASYDLVVDRDGNVTLPRIGPLRVAGMDFSAMKSYLEKEAARIVGASVNVTMGELKSIRVFVLGDVRRPGSYAMDSFSTITTALMAAGGPTEIGSLRNVQLKRDGETIAVMDFYGLLLRGDKSSDLVLQSGDIVFVPTVGPLVGVAGNVKRPAIYELREKLDLGSLFELAGGIIPSAYTQQIQVSRIQRNERQVVLDVNEEDLEEAGGVMLQDADLVKVFPIVDRDQNAVYLRGNVKRPGKYELKPGMRVSDVIKEEADLLGETHLDYALIKRLATPDHHAELVPFDLGKAIAGGKVEDNVVLMPRDTIFVFSRWLFRDRPFVTVQGEVRNPGRLDLSERMTIKDAILAAGSLKKEAYTAKAEIIRVDEDRNYRTIYFDLEKAMKEGPEENLELRDEDRIVIHSIREYAYSKEVVIDGDVLRPGTYQYVEDMTVKDLVFAAGNVLQSAYLSEAELSSRAVEDAGPAKLERKTINLKRALAGDPAHNMPLKPRDRLLVRQIEDWHETRMVEISGEVRFPGKYVIAKGERLSSLIQRAGGFSGEAYLRGAVFTRQRVKEVQQRQLREMVERLEKELFARGAAETSSSLTKDEAEIREFEIEQKKQFLRKLRTYEAKGRMFVRLDRPERLRETDFDIELEDGDRLYVPSDPRSVQVIGSVYNQMAYVHDRDRSLSDYIELSGGYTENADRDRVYVLKADGTAEGAGGRDLSGLEWNSASNRWETDYQGIGPGDTIVVPEKLEKTAWMRETKDLTQILYQIAVAAGVVLVAF